MAFVERRAPPAATPVSTPLLPASGSLPPRLQAMLHALQERRTRTAADRELARRLQFAIENTEMGAEGGLSVYVHEGSVAVYGLIRSEALRERVLDLVAEQPGVRRIQDHLQRPAA